MRCRWCRYFLGTRCGHWWRSTPCRELFGCLYQIASGHAPVDEPERRARGVDVYPPRVMRPLPPAGRFTNPNLQRIADAPLSLVRGRPPGPAAEPTTPRRGIVEARLLGTFELRVDGRGVSKWVGQRGTSVLRYLLSRRRHACARDELLEAFWPGVAPDAARNRLQVAVSGLRRALREVTNLHVIEYAEGGYRINPELRVEVDVECFEKMLSTARRAERSGDLDRALTAYREATELYRGDFASDVPYEQWTLLPRETLRLTYIDALDRVSRIQLSAGRLDDCIATAHRMLDIDPCCEDAHRLLMRCYTSQGRNYQAVRQYDFCLQILKRTLDVEPAPETTRLYRAIRAGFAGKPALID